MKNLNTSAMLSSLSISVYSGRKFDKKATKEVSTWHGTDEKVGRYSKRLLPDDAKSYKAINTAASAARAAFYENTLPWLDTGARILTSANFIPCTTIMRKAESEYWQAVPIFIAEWPLLKARAKVALNGLYEEKDYPSADKLKDRFSFEIRFFPLPDSQDFRADLRQEDVDAIKAQIDLDTTNTIHKAMEEPYRRLFDGVAHMASRLQGAKTCPCRKCKGKTFTSDDFADSLVDNLVELCDVLPRLNLTGDQELELLIDEVKASLTPFTPDSIKGSDALRKTLASRAQEIQDTMAGFGFISQVA